jgi:hypothetical protein
MRKKFVLSMLGTLFCLAGCGGPTGPRQLISIAVQPVAAQAIAPDGTVPFSATGTFDQRPTVQTNLPVKWASSDPTIATIDPATGVATCVTVGGPISVSGSTTGKGGTVQSSGKLTCQLSPNAVAKLDPPSVHARCFILCDCIYSPGGKVTVTNVGGAPLDIASVALLSGRQGFSQINSCNTSLDTGQSCEIDIHFSPSHSSNVVTTSDEVVVTDNASGSPQNVQLSSLSTCQ